MNCRATPSHHGCQNVHVRAPLRKLHCEMKLEAGRSIRIKRANLHVIHRLKKIKERKRSCHDLPQKKWVIMEASNTSKKGVIVEATRCFTSSASYPYFHNERQLYHAYHFLRCLQHHANPPPMIGYD